MTTTTTDLSVGQRVRVTFPGEDPRTGEVTFAQECGGGCCRGMARFDDTGLTGWISNRSTVERLDSEADPFPVGTRVRTSFYGTGTVVEKPGVNRSGDPVDEDFAGPDYRAVRVDGFDGEGYYGGDVFNVSLARLTVLDESESDEALDKLRKKLSEPEAEDSALTEARAEAKANLDRAVKAERELEAFRDQVRDAVIREAEARDWCSEADNWLEELGLEPRSHVYHVYVTATVTVPFSIAVTDRDEDGAADYVTDSSVVQDELDSMFYGTSVTCSMVDFELDRVVKD